MSRYLLFFLFPFICAFSKPKVYDCFPFFNELELLEIRLEEMYDHVDHFVIVESEVTFRGDPKPLYFAENRDRFKKYEDKIIYVLAKDTIQGENKHWDREVYQRNQIMEGLKKCSKKDIILISDVDEIIRGSDVKRLTAPLRQTEHKVVRAQQRLYILYMNRLAKEFFCHGTVAATYGYLKSKSPEKVRSMRNSAIEIPDVGWHFSSMGGLERYVYKLSSFSHWNEYTDEQKDPNFIHNHIQSQLHLVVIDESFPRFIFQHQEELLKLGFVDFQGNPAYQ